jgi:retron-type reverse transcriptase
MSMALKFDRTHIALEYTQIQTELVSETYRPMHNRRKEIPNGSSQVGVFGIPGIRDPVAQGSLKLILEAVFEADLQSGSYRYRLKRTAHEAVSQVAKSCRSKQDPRHWYGSQSLLDGFKKWAWLLNAAYRRLAQEHEKLELQVTPDKIRIVDLTRDETFR